MQVIYQPEYQQWLESFGSETKHIYANSTATSSATILPSPALMQARLHCIHPVVFPLHHNLMAGNSFPMHSPTCHWHHVIAGPARWERIPVTATMSGQHQCRSFLPLYWGRICAVSGKRRVLCLQVSSKPLTTAAVNTIMKTDQASSLGLLGCLFKRFSSCSFANRRTHG